MDCMTIGEVARRAGIAPATLRYYERRGILVAPERTTAGHRRYATPVLEELAVIKRWRAEGYSLGQISVMLDLVRQGPADCGPVVQMARQRIAELGGLIESLTAIKTRLAAWIGACGTDPCKLTLEDLLCPDAVGEQQKEQNGSN
jgi:DNA-binding transcriptional MerR regulator